MLSPHHTQIANNHNIFKCQQKSKRTIKEIIVVSPTQWLHTKLKLAYSQKPDPCAWRFLTQHYDLTIFGHIVVTAMPHLAGSRQAF